jgi:hypothetical protein
MKHLCSANRLLQHQPPPPRSQTALSYTHTPLCSLTLSHALLSILSPTPHLPSLHSTLIGIHGPHHSQMSCNLCSCSKTSCGRSLTRSPRLLPRVSRSPHPPHLQPPPRLLQSLAPGKPQSATSHPTPSASLAPCSLLPVKLAAVAMMPCSSPTTRPSSSSSAVVWPS